MIQIFEGLFLLALDEEEGDIVEAIAGRLEPALSGAILVELILQNRVRVADNRIQVTEPSPTMHPVLDMVLSNILESSKPRKLRYWIHTLIYQQVKEEIGQHLIEEVVLVRKKKRLRWVIPTGEGYRNSTSVKYEVKNCLREVILAGREPDLREKVLLAFLYHAELLKLVFTQGERKVAQKRVKRLVAKTDESESSLGEPIEEILAVSCQVMKE